MMTEQEQIIHNKHEEAMNLAEEGFFLKRNKMFVEAKEKFNEAFKLEKEVADHIINNDMILEPSRSIICLSAANLAKDAELFDEAKLYAQKVIHYNVYDDLVQEAYEILNK